MNSELITIIRETCVLRTDAVRKRVGLVNRAGAILRRFLGWRLDLPPADRKAIAAQAQAAWTALRKDGASAAQAAAPRISPAILAYLEDEIPQVARYEKMQKGLDHRLADLAGDLPAAAWVADVRGFSLLGLALVVGEAGDLGGYATPAKLWKRFGLGRFKDPASDQWLTQRRYTDADKAEAAGYNPVRRSLMHQLGEPLIRRGKADGAPYYRVYADRKAFEAARTDEAKPASPMHAHRRAMRYMEKRLLRDLWRAWRRNGSPSRNEP